MMIEGPKGTTVMNANPKGTITHRSCYEKKFGTNYPRDVNRIRRSAEIRKDAGHSPIDDFCDIDLLAKTDDDPAAGGPLSRP